MEDSLTKPITATVRRLKNRYRVLVTNEDSFEEVVTFRVTSTRVYIALSTIFVLLTSVTVAILVLTPLKYYIPGYASVTNKNELQLLKMRTDSLEQSLIAKERYLSDIKTVLMGNEQALRDTQALVVPEPEKSTY